MLNVRLRSRVPSVVNPRSMKRVLNLKGGTVNRYAGSRSVEEATTVSARLDSAAV